MRFIACVLLFLLAPNVPAQIPISTPVERTHFTRLTSSDTLQAFLRGVERPGRIQLSTIATTVQGRPVTACLISASPRFGQDTTKLRVMLNAQQHGDEPSGKEALTVLLGKIAGGDCGGILEKIDLILIPQMNPDGSELRQRRTADSLDLNRNHLLLTSPAPRGLHELFARWRPEVTMDIHEYSPYSSSWSDSGFIKLADVQLGMLTNLNSPPVLRHYQRQNVFPFVAERMKTSGYNFQEYIVGSPSDFMRYSTTEPNDGRQSFGILGTLSFIQEGRGGRTLEENLERRVLTQLRSIEAFLEVCALRSGEIRSLVSEVRRELSAGADRDVVLCMDHVATGTPVTIPVRLVPSGRDSLWQVHPLRGAVEPLLVRRLPAAYLIPKELTSVIALLDRHGVQKNAVTAPDSIQADHYRIDSVTPDTLEDEWHPKPALTVIRRSTFLRPGDVIVPTRQLHALFLGILLEPESMWGLVKYPGYEFMLAGKFYPVVRIPR